MKTVLRFAALVAAGALCASSSPAATNVQAAFQKLRNLAGHWAGTDAQGKTVKSVFQMIAGNTAVMETLYPPDMDAMVTLYSIDRSTISLMHYCPTNNQPHMRAIPPAGPLKQLVFQFQGAGNLPNLAVGHEYKLVLDFRDNDHIVEHWTWRQNGKDSQMVYDLHRKSS